MIPPDFPEGPLPPPRRLPFIDPLTAIIIIVAAAAVGVGVGLAISGGTETYAVETDHMEFNDRIRANLNGLDQSQQTAPRPGARFSALEDRTALLSEIYPGDKPSGSVAQLRHADCLWIASREKMQVSWEVIATGLRKDDGAGGGEPCIVDSIGACTYSHPVTREPLICEAGDDPIGAGDEKELWVDAWLNGEADRFEIHACRKTPDPDNHCVAAGHTDSCEAIPYSSFCSTGQGNENKPFCAMGCDFRPAEDATVFLEVPVIGPNGELPLKRQLAPALRVVGSDAQQMTREMEPHAGSISDPYIGASPPGPDEVEYRWRVPETGDGRLVENFSNTMRIVAIRFFAGNAGARREIRALRLGVKGLSSTGPPGEICENESGPPGYTVATCSQLEIHVPTYLLGCLKEQSCDLLRWHAAFLRREGEHADNPEALGTGETPFIEFTVMPFTTMPLFSQPTRASAELQPGAFNFADAGNGGPPAIGETRQLSLTLLVTGPGQTDLIAVGVDGMNASDFTATIQGATTGAPLPGRASYPIEVTYTPTAAPPARGSFTRLARLFVRLRQNGQVGEVSTSLLSYVAEHELQVLDNGSPVEELQFAYSMFNRVQLRPLVLRNRRAVDNVVTSMRIQGPDAGAFQLWDTQAGQPLSIGPNGILLTGSGGQYGFGLRFVQPSPVPPDLDATLVIRAFSGERRISLADQPPPALRRWIVDTFDTRTLREVSVRGGN